MRDKGEKAGEKKKLLFSKLVSSVLENKTDSARGFLCVPQRVTV